MRKQVQLPGVRKWFGDDFTSIQDEHWKVTEQLFGQYNYSCILAGCKVSLNGGNFNVSPGIVLIKDVTSSEWQYAEFAGAVNIALPQYMVLVKTVTNELYADGNNKARVITFDADFQSGLPTGNSNYNFLTFTSTGARAWTDVIQDTTRRFVTDTQINAWNANIAVVAGMIMAWPGFGAIPSGWLECNGSTISRTTYAELFAAIGDNYGAGDGSTTFVIPDLRGQHIRGHDNGRGVDVGRVMGSGQAAQVGEITIPLPTTGYAGIGDGDRLIQGLTGYTATRNLVVNTNAENRVANVAMKWIIKI